jgi:hypothetical protein
MAGPLCRSPAASALPLIAGGKLKALASAWRRAAANAVAGISHAAREMSPRA